MTVSTIGVAMLLQSATVFTVHPGGDLSTLADAVRIARAGDTILVEPGVYEEHVVIDKALVIRGKPGVILDGGGSGIVVTIRAPTTLTGLTVRNSGSSLPTEDAAIMVLGAPDVRIEGNRLHNVLFGIYAKESPRIQVVGNHIVGQSIPLPARGDGIRLWYSHGGRIEDNVLHRVRDLVIWFSNETTVRDNLVRESRYGLHFMYSHDNRFERNRFLENHVGAFLMYSSGITFRENVFAHARGASGKGLAFKDTDHIRAVDNVLVKNAVGVYLDNSPTTRGVTSDFTRNVVAFNDIGVKLLPSVAGNTFAENQFIDNVVPVAVSGGGTAMNNTWRANFWSAYAGFDANGDGYGDTPYVHERLADDLFTKHETLRVYELSPATVAINALGRFFPLLAPSAVVVDSAPQISRRGGTGLAVGERRPVRWPAVMLLSLTALGGTVLTIAARSRSARRRG